MITVYETAEALYILRAGKVTRVLLDAQKENMRRLLDRLAAKQRIRYVKRSTPSEPTGTI